ncbi:hypothetical protein Tsp_04129 [Trichinella spiralis]|uniref:hypothetical protein n=1 Tax=Trichinella spiralis TaxID=6334 RepID=UPI0001EFB758|nr:hypothetical protein Tsp_04129 [Trichinella spiralis]
MNLHVFTLYSTKSQQYSKNVNASRLSVMLKCSLGALSFFHWKVNLKIFTHLMLPIFGPASLDMAGLIVFGPKLRRVKLENVVLCSKQRKLCVCVSVVGENCQLLLTVAVAYQSGANSFAGAETKKLYAWHVICWESHQCQCLDKIPFSGPAPPPDLCLPA